MTERDENNRLIARWLGWTYESGSKDEFPGWYGGPYQYCGPHKINLPDFYTDEAANALLLEKMATIYPDEYIHLEHLKYIGWTILSCHGYKGVTHADRKTAIVNAALALIARQG